MEIVFVYGAAAAGKLTVGRHLAQLTGLPLFHNHLVVDAVGAVFAFGSEPFIRLRESFWLQVFTEAARSRRSLIFTFAPEATVDPGFPERVRATVEQFSGSVRFIALTVSPEEQERRIGNASRSEFAKLTSIELLRELRDSFDASMAAMPVAELSIDTETCEPIDAAKRIVAHLSA
ncbi:MAG: shikimate kinase [Brevundimonas sp.]